MKYKMGITVASLVVYVILLFAFTTIALTVSGNVTSSVYKDKGLAVNLSNLDKIQYYLNKSAMESQSVEINDNTLTFSNGDIYLYNTSKKAVYYNNGILCTDVTNLAFTSSSTNLYHIEIELTKYSIDLQRSITIYVGV